MAKKSKFKLGTIPLICGVVGILALCLFMFLPMISYSIGESCSTTYQGLAKIFGGEANTVTVAKKLIGERTTTSQGTIEGVTFNFMTFLPWILTLVGSLVLVASSFVKQLSNNLFKFVGGGLVLAAGILMFFVTDSASLAICGGNENALEASLLLGKYALSTGAILGGILGCVAGGGTIASLIISK